MRGFIQEKVGNRRIVILGFGMEGQSSLSYLLQLSLNNEMVVADQNPEIKNHSLIIENQIPIISGEQYFDSLDGLDFIIKSPGVPLRKHRPDLISYSQTSLFLEYFGKQIIGITGTKGKSTTSTMMYRILKDQNIKSFLVGNIGQPAFDLIPQISSETLIVYELSAHQLQCVRQGPRMAILLNLMPEHLDYFENVDAYYQAKGNIFEAQAFNSFSFIHKKTHKKLNKSFSNTLNTEIANEQLHFNDEVLIGRKDLKYLLGAHHIENIQALMELILFLKLDLEKALETIKNFHPLPHRQEYLGEINGLRFINDSISTIPQSAIQAIKAIEKVDYLIIGGLDRGIDYSELVAFLRMSSLKKVFFLGKAGQRVLEELETDHQQLSFAYSHYDCLQDIRDELIKIREGTVLLSPAAASYDYFKNFEERGDYFRGIFSEILKK